MSVESKTTPLFEPRLSNYIRELVSGADHSKLQLIFPLLRVGCCPRCALRYAELRSYSIYREPDDFLRCFIERIHQQLPEDIRTKEPLPSGQPTIICVACLGILQFAVAEDFIAHIIQSVKTCGYEFEDYSLAMNLPTSTIIRQYALWYYLRNHLASIGGASLSATPENKIVEIKEAFKWIFGYILQQKSIFNVLLSFRHPESESESEFLASIEGSGIKRRKIHRDAARTLQDTSASQTSVIAALKAVSMEQFCRHGTSPPQPVHTRAELELAFERGAVFVAGRYIKLSRELSQSPWVVDGQRVIDSSVQELIGEPIVKHFQAAAYKFSSAGREDIDVRMLGNGRPFVVEVINARMVPKDRSQYVLMQREINQLGGDRLQIRDLQLVAKDDTNKMKEGEQAKKKTYCCVVWVSRGLSPSELAPLSELRDLTISQKTPVRVLHRRTLATREKAIYSLSAEWLNPHFFVLRLTTQAGTYVKEFVHGDLGRTSPCLGDLLHCEADILQLDVVEVDLNFPPPLVDPAACVQHAE